MAGSLINQQTPITGPPDAQPHNYVDYRQFNSYSYDPGILVLPVAGPPLDADDTPVPPRVIRVSAPIAFRSERTSASKVLTPPIVPPISADSPEGDVNIGGNLSLPLPQVNPGRGFNYFANMERKFVQMSPRGSLPTDTFQMGNYPFPLPDIDLLTATNPSLTVDYSGDPEETVLESEQPPDGGTTQNVNWAWTSTTFMPFCFFQPADIVPDDEVA